jgi:hypothetical protein
MCRRPPARRDNLPTPMPLVVLLHGQYAECADFATGTAMNADESAAACACTQQTASGNARSCAGIRFEPGHQVVGRGEPIAALTRHIWPRPAGPLPDSSQPAARRG